MRSKEADPDGSRKLYHRERQSRTSVVGVRRWRPLLASVVGVRRCRPWLASVIGVRCIVRGVGSGHCIIGVISSGRTLCVLHGWGFNHRHPPLVVLSAVEGLSHGRCIFGSVSCGRNSGALHFQGRQLWASFVGAASLVASVVDVLYGRSFVGVRHGSNRGDGHD